MPSRAVKCILIAFSLVVIINLGVAWPPVAFLNSDRPIKQDAVMYLLALNRSLNYIDKVLAHKDLQPVIMVNSLFGMFLMKVNLKHALKHNGYKLGLDIKRYMMDMVHYSEGIHLKYRQNIDIGNYNSTAVKFANLIDDDLVWMTKLSKFHLDRTRFSAFYVFEFEERWLRPCLYLMRCWEHISDFDQCYSRISDHKLLPECMIGDDCLHAAIGGGDIGYTLAHRILIFLLANYARDCAITQNDATALMILCERAFSESVYISNHWYENSDLLFEFIALCSINGESEFIRRSWFSRLLSFQTKEGDFKIPPSPEFEICQKKLNKVTFSPHHFVSVSVAALGGATRFILENL